ncbi:predicted protein [Aspergillus nidulans FGSC A4]|uniref:Uncharacterized protein n=1 Tax=Emericella nidulans (strain FGSC A4 / ATCC 38163 / CBS 112.46 / NRRL 194 / M139) TaxID=227321 RepID=Q5AVN7_EMENI|nr:hypothetical protein [Aspergillus nidulans FGSC A4]EAA61829.1 predicted protein [Aspergillus nidulans FGSC A4]CBF79804.1 TPA: hypothetical protein ANIA_07643 [Aspergillus nidulans FGSC A4]|eukprot:XP_680912.1 predicted protein [Aspergillus nidulans FGSC A4]
MDNCDVYYIVLILDPQVKGDLILSEIEDKEAVANIVNDIISGEARQILGVPELQLNDSVHRDTDLKAKFLNQELGFNDRTARSVWR